MALMVLATDSTNEDILQNINGEFAVLYGEMAALQSIRQMIKTWARTYIFNNLAGFSYDAVIGSDFNTASFIAETDLIKMFGSNSEQSSKWAVNWNQLLKQKINGNQLYSDEDYALYNTTINNVVFSSDKRNALIVKMIITFGSGRTQSLTIPLNDVVISLKRPVLINEIKTSPYVPQQPFLSVTINAAPNIVIPPGKLTVIVSLKPLGICVYSNYKTIICNNYYNNRVLKLTFDTKDSNSKRNIHSEFYTVLSPMGMNVNILNEPITNE